MGRVFRYDEIQANLVPDVSNFQAATDTFRGTATRAAEDGHIVSAVIFGSVSGLLTGNQGITPNSRSDFDSILAVKGIIAATREASNDKIPIQPLLYLKDQLAHGDKEGMHDINQLFGMELTGTNRFVIGEDPASFIRFPDRSAATLLGNFIARKRRFLHDGLTQTVESQQGVQSLQQLLELPVVISREAILAMILHDVYPADQSPIVSNKKQVVRDITNILLPESTSLVAGLEDLMGRDKSYNVLLTLACAHRIDQDQYNANLHNLADYRGGLLWLAGIHRAIGKRLET